MSIYFSRIKTLGIANYVYISVKYYIDYQVIMQQKMLNIYTYLAMPLQIFFHSFT